MKAETPQFRRIGAFSEEYNPREILQLEDNIRQKLQADDQAQVEPFSLTGLQSIPYTARFAELVRVDTRAASIVILLPRPDDPLADSIRVVNVTTGSFPVLLIPLDGDVTVDLSAGYSFSGRASAVHLIPDRFSKNWIVVDSAQSDTTITPTTLSADQTDYSPTGWAGARYVRLSTTVGIQIFSFDSTLLTQKRKTLIHVGGDFDIRIRNNSFATSIAANRVAGVIPNDLYLLRGYALDIWYDDVSSCWRPV